MSAHAASSHPSPLPIFDALNAYQKTMALKGAVELDIFTHIADGATTAAEIAQRCQAAERGVRILCDFLTINGLLTKTAGQYGLTQDTAVFLNKRSPAYMGGAAKFLAHERHMAHFKDVAAAVRKGGALDDGNMGPDDPVWVEFAQSMSEMISSVSKLVAPAVMEAIEPGRALKVLDVAAGHGLFGIAIAELNPAAEIVAVDWKNVLDVTIGNAAKAGVSQRFRTIPGSAFDVDFGGGYDVALLPNFLHHFDPPTNVTLLKKVRAAMKPGGLVATVEQVPNEDRVSPPIASFSMMMLCSTPSGDAYTFRELDQMFREAGFGESTARGLEPTFATLLLTKW
jgi:2-polyprenyl-3-methyl-5-hydroxy-6-metoxy-1,4-benzoquinol methylase